MDKTDPPESFGVFKPLGHTLMAFREVATVQAAADALLEQGFTSADVVRYSPQEMIDQVDRELQQASPLAALGQEINLIRAHRELAQSGCSFLVVNAPEDDQAERVAAVARRLHAVVAQRYGRFIIEELIDKTHGEAQVFESPARGIDIDVPDTLRP